MKTTGIVMHPLPRVDELDFNIDNNPRAKYFNQIENGVYMRAALLWNVLTDRHKSNIDTTISSIN
jgi:aspartate carbamoyltransferase catalytic subunit